MSAAQIAAYVKQDRSTLTHRDLFSLPPSSLSVRLNTRLSFGTAGLRGPSTNPDGSFKAGYNILNPVVVMQTTLGLARYLTSISAQKTVVIAADGRHHALYLSRLAASVLVHEGFEVFLFEQCAITPLVPFAVRQLGAGAGVMVTASHNPAGDQGYDSTGVQIIPPVDEQVQASIMRSLDVPEPMWDISNLNSHPLLRSADYLIERYVAEAVDSLKIPDPSQTKLVHTSLHGTADRYLSAAFAAAGIQPYFPVEKQQHPDPFFPTVIYPNPEEGEGVLKLAYETADQYQANYIIANDPDCDRFCACERGSDGKWKAFSGNEMGLLLAYNTLQSYKAENRPLDKLAFLATTPSSSLIGMMAEQEGFKYVETLSGFKWIGNGSITLEKEGYEPMFGFEEAIGYAIGRGVRDKDGVTACLAFVQMLTRLEREGLTVSKHLEQLYERYGNVINLDSYYKVEDAAMVDSIFKSLRFNSNSSSIRSLQDYPTRLGPFTVQAVRDMTEYWDSSTVDQKPVLPFTGGQMITFSGRSSDDSETGPRFKLTIRTSGTEPKVKYYLQAAGNQARDELRNMLNMATSDLHENWIRAEYWNIKRK